MEGGHWKTCGGHGLGDGNVWTLSNVSSVRPAGKQRGGWGWAENERMMVVEQVPRYMDAPLFKHENKPTGHYMLAAVPTAYRPHARRLSAGTCSGSWRVKRVEGMRGHLQAIMLAFLAWDRLRLQQTRRKLERATGHHHDPWPPFLFFLGAACRTTDPRGTCF